LCTIHLKLQAERVVASAALDITVGSSSRLGEVAVKPIEVTYYDTDIAIVALHGEHDWATRHELRQIFQSLLRSGELVVIDLSQAEFIDSSVLHSLLQATNEAQGRGLSVTLQLGTARNVRRILEVTGLLDRLPCATTREEAIQLARTGTVEPVAG
jgi:anti-anti-sigma factor